MAKIRKVLKALEAAGWAVVATRDDLLQLAHPKRTGRLTLPDRKTSLPDDVALPLLAAAGLKIKGH